MPGQTERLFRRRKAAANGDRRDAVAAGVDDGDPIPLPLPSDAPTTPPPQHRDVEMTDADGWRYGAVTRALHEGSFRAPPPSPPSPRVDSVDVVVPSARYLEGVSSAPLSDVRFCEGEAERRPSGAAVLFGCGLVAYFVRCVARTLLCGWFPFPSWQFLR